MTCQNKLTIKKGDTLSWVLTYRDSNGDEINLTDYIVTSSIKSVSGDFEKNLAYTMLSQTSDKGKFILSAQTNDFPLGNLLFDVMFNLNNTIVRTNTATLTVVEGVTDA